MRTRGTGTQHRTTTMGHTLEASHEMISAGMVATVEKTINTVESEEDTPLFKQKLQRVLVFVLSPQPPRKIETFALLSTSSKRGTGKQSKLRTAKTGIKSEKDSMSERIVYS